MHFRDDLNTPEIEYFLRLAREGAGFSFLPEYLMEYRTHPHSATTAGLWGERLAPYLLAMETDAEVEPWKRQFMAGLLPGAVTRCLLQGDAARAREFLHSPYYPASGPTGGVRATQSFCAAIPGGSALYRLLFSLRHKGLATPPPSRVS